MTLKLMTYEPTGAPVAAATPGLPEQAGGERTTASPGSVMDPSRCTHWQAWATWTRQPSSACGSETASLKAAPATGPAFEKLQTYGNHLGLFSEEMGSTGEQLGNFPQAFTHLSLINAAITLNSELDRRARRTEPAPMVA